ncbi:adaptor-related protein complex 3, delta 1 subunit-like garnet isoform X2 [Oratosquilla oratoria]|uniref:adaptor-related protein complex 3, delta 1 subunit-like garnet isoform X2 n=1 Tax=Oratosquilla oratoria TaxID=337810 RepID=UPI003F765C15
MALRKVKGNLERMFDKNLTDLVRGIRNNKDNESKYIAQCMEEIKTELRQENLTVKANAVAKLTYLQMLGYDISWAGFNIIEVMSSPKFTFKRIGYLSASQCFHQDTEILMLTTNMIRKDLNSQNMYDAGTALTGLACFINADLARDLANDVMTLLTSTKPYLRKKAVLLMYKVFLKFPEALRPAFPRLKEKLEDPDPGVQSASVNVICELARKNPKNYLSLAPVFFKLMTSSTNNWMLIKIIKLFGILTGIEPRLGRKLSEPLIEIISSTSAMSLLYECINTVIAVLISISSGMPNHNASIQLCVQKLRILIEDSDQNLKYLGLLAMSKILKSHPKSVQSHKDLVLQCLDDKDESIRLRALDLLYGMVSKKTVMEIVKRLMTHMDRAEGTSYRDELLQKIILICSQNNYQFIANFEWYISVLVELCRMEGSQHGGLIASQLLDVAIRVVAVREFTVGQMALLLDNAHVIVGPAAARSSIAEVLYAASWICGEFSQYLSNPKATLESMLRGKVASLPGHIQAAYIQNMFKLYTRIISMAEEEEDSEMMEEVECVTNLLLERLPVFASSCDLEVQERASCMLQLVTFVHKCHKCQDRVGSDLALLVSGELNPVAPKAQKKVPIPDGLDLDAWINEPPSESEGEDDDAFSNDIFIKADHASKEKKNHKHEPTEEELQKRRDARRAEQASNPYYVKSSPSTTRAPISNNVEEIPVTSLDLNVPLKIPGMTSLSKYQIVDGWEGSSSKKHKKRKKNRKHRERVSSSSEEETPPVLVVNTDAGEMPEGANMSDEEDNDGRPEDDPHRALDINLDEPLSPGETLPTRVHREVKRDEDKPKKVEADNQKTDKSKSSSKKKKKEKKENKKRKESHKKSKKEKPQEADIISLGDSLQNTTIHQENQPEPNHINGVEETQDKDMDIWLSPEVPENQVCEGIMDQTVEAEEKKQDETPATVSKKKKKKEKKEKEKSKKERSSKKSTARDRTEYEEANGSICQELQESIPMPEETVNPVKPCVKLMAEDSHLRLLYSMEAMEGVMAQVVTHVTFTNLASSPISNLVLHLPDTKSIKMIRTVVNSEDFDLPWRLEAGSTQEQQFTFTAEDVTVPHKLRGSLSYSVDGMASELPLKVDFAITSFLSGRTASRATFTDLLASGQLTARSSFTITDFQLPFCEVLAAVTHGGSLAVVEQVDSTASLYGRSLHGHHVCLLLKNATIGRLTVDGKSTEGTLLSNTLDHMKMTLVDMQQN